MYPPAAIPPTAATRRPADAGSAAAQSRRSTSPATPRRAGPSGTADWRDGLAPLDALPRDLWRFAVALDGIAALDSDERLARVGLRAPSPSRADWPAYQVVGERLWAEGYASVQFASAARPASRALCVFRPGHALPGMRPFRRPCVRAR